MSEKEWDDKELRIIAATAGIDVRTVRRILVKGLRPRSPAIKTVLAMALLERGHKREAQRLNARETIA